jgi:hypothetical protein
MNRQAVAWVAALLFLSGGACAPASENGGGDGGPGTVEDAGFFENPDAGPGSNESDSGASPSDAGSPPAGNDGGSGPPDAGFNFGDGGFLDISDASAFLYDGVQEEGVRCGDNLDVCAVDDACCVVIGLGGTSGACLSETGTCTAGPTDVVAKVDCDGHEDCSGSQVCCITGAFPNLAGECVANPDECTVDRSGTLVCVSQDDCPPDTVCCGTDFAVSVDMGICVLPQDCG